MWIRYFRVVSSYLCYKISSSIRLAGSFSQQADGLIQLIVQSEKEIHRRLHYMTLLQEGLSEYLYNPEVVMFGSSITGVGTIDSDIVSALSSLPLCQFRMPRFSLEIRLTQSRT